jgi:hypothetical protein
MSVKKLTLILGAALLVLAAVGCSDDDPVTPQETVLNGEMAEEWTMDALAMVSEMSMSVSDWAEADFSSLTENKADVQPEWDPEQQAYVYAYDVTETDPPNSWEVRLDLWLQYRDAGVPVQYPLGADEMQARMTSGMTAHTEGEDGIFDLDYDFATDMTVTNLDTDLFNIAGVGETVVNASQVMGDQSETIYFSMSWDMDLTATPGGCPAGTANVYAGGFALAAVYDGEGGVAWTLTGPDYHATGTETLECGLVNP